MTPLLLRLWEATFADTVRRAETDARAFRRSPAGNKFDTKTCAVLGLTAGCLVGQNYAGASDAADPLARLLWWAGSAVVFYAVVPAAVIRLCFREQLADYGLKLRGVLAGGPIYVAFVAVMVPLVAVFSGTPGFQATYPFYRIGSAAEVDGRLLRWELLYAAQFVALEFFFRGFVLHGTKRRFGAYAIPVMTVPYCMIHFTKPLPECAASIVAGVALGLMSLKTRSVWLGAALHITVAWGMDFACLWRRGLI